MRSEIRKLKDVTRQQLIRLLTGIAAFHEEFGKRRTRLPTSTREGEVLGLHVTDPSGEKFILATVMGSVEFELIDLDGDPKPFDHPFGYDSVVIKLVPNVRPDDCIAYPEGSAKGREGSFDLMPAMQNIINRAMGYVPETEVREAFFVPHGAKYK